MSIYGENYKKTMNGYNKISNTISSIITMEQLTCIPRMIEGWVGLVDKYCDEVYYDKSNRNRKKDADRLGDAAKEMFDDLKEQYQDALQDFNPEEYEGRFRPIRVKSLPEMVHEYNEEYE